MAGLEIDGVTVTFGDTTAVDDVSTTIERGEVLAVLGPSGCGKSTLLRVVAGLQEPTAGTVRFDGADVTKVPIHRRGFAMMFQDGQLFNHLSVAANVAYPLRRQGVSRKLSSDRAHELLELVGLPEAADRAPRSLSGGQQQRVALARALAASPRLLLLDEPLSALDRTLRERLAGEVRTILTQTNTTALFVTHDHDEALSVADRIALMRHGRIVQQGPAAEVWRDPVDVEAARFLGYRSVVTGAAAHQLCQVAHLPTSDVVALRPSALVVDASGAIEAQVTSAVMAADGIRLGVDAGALGTLEATSYEAELPSVGQRVRLRLIRAAVACPAMGADA